MAVYQYTALGEGGRKIHGVPVVGGIDRVRRTVQALGVEEIIIAVPTASADEYVHILDQCASTGVRLRRLPSRMSDIVRLTQVRDVRVDDLLDREAAKLDRQMLKTSFGGRSLSTSSSTSRAFRSTIGSANCWPMTSSTSLLETMPRRTIT